MGIIRDIFRGDRSLLLDAAAARFESDPEELVGGADIDPAVFGLTSYSSAVAYSPKIDRRSAEQVPAVKRTHDLIAGTLGGLPIINYAADKSLVANRLFEQPEKNVPRSVTMSRTIADLVYDEIAWWRIVGADSNGFPLRVKRLKSGTVTVDDDRGMVFVNGQHVPDDELIRFDSPTRGLLIAGARAIRTCLMLDAAAARYVDGTPPMDYFVPKGEVDPFADKDETVEFLEDWQTSRQSRTTGYVPFLLDYKTSGWDPEKLQLASARQHAVLEIARVGGIDPEELGVSTTSRTYQNEFDRRKGFTDFTLGLYMHAMEDRLSMGDVTPRGEFARFDLDAFMRSDPKTRMETYVLGRGVNAYTDDEIRDSEDKQPLTPAQKAAPAPARLQLVPQPGVAASSPPEVTFDGEPEIRLDMPQDGLNFSVDYERRTITGRFVPYGVVGIANGMRWVFSQGSIKFTDFKRIKMWIGHDKNDVRGYGLTFDDRPDGLWGTLKVEEGEKGDEALRKADPDGSATWDAFSIGLRPGGKFRTVAGINYAVEAPLMEISLTPAPSFDDARVHQVAASATEGDSMTPEQRARLAALREQSVRNAEEEAELVRLTALETSNLATATFDASGNPVEPPTFDAQPIIQAISDGFNAMHPQRENVSATETIEVNEGLPYRFDGIGGDHGFLSDISSAYRSGDGEARQRLDTFLDETFAVTTGNTASLNPPQNRPDLYVPQLQYSTPLWDMVSTGGLDDQTPFTVPKFSSSSGLVGDHTQGTEPTPGTFVATSQTVTPAPLSGKIEINREVWDQGGNPKADQIIWAEFLNAWYEAREARIAALLAAVPTTEVNLGSAVDSALVDAVTNIFVGLQFVRGGNRFTGLALDGGLFPALVDAADTTGRKLLPVRGPQNAQGETSGGFDRISIGNQTGRAAWALGAELDSQSYLFVPSSVYAWASAPKRFTFEYQVKSVDMAIWGYSAEAVLRDSDVRPIDYTTLDEEE